jgi:hypothetical protein
MCAPLAFNGTPYRNHRLLQIKRTICQDIRACPAPGTISAERV